MATVANGKAYRFRAYDDNKRLNILTDSNLIGNLNVTTYERVFQDLAQVCGCKNYTVTNGGIPVSGML